MLTELDLNKSLTNFEKVQTQIDDGWNQVFESQASLENYFKNSTENPAAAYDILGRHEIVIRLSDDVMPESNFYSRTLSNKNEVLNLVVTEVNTERKVYKLEVEISNQNSKNQSYFITIDMNVKTPGILFEPTENLLTVKPSERLKTIGLATLESKDINQFSIHLVVYRSKFSGNKFHKQLKDALSQLFS